MPSASMRRLRSGSFPPGHFAGARHAARRGRFHAHDSTRSPDAYRFSASASAINPWSRYSAARWCARRGSCTARCRPSCMTARVCMPACRSDFEAGRYHSLIADAGQHPGRARSHGADRGRRDHGRAASITADRRGAISPGKRAHAGWSDSHGQFSQDLNRDQSAPHARPPRATPRP